MYSKHLAGRPRRVLTAQKVAFKLLEGDEVVRLNLFVVWQFRHPIYQESMLHKLKRRVERIVGAPVEIDATYSKSNKLVGLRVRRSDVPLPV